MSWFTVYLFTRLDGIHECFEVFLIGFGIISGTISVLFLFYKALEDEYLLSPKTMKKGCKWGGGFYTILILLYLLVPTTKEYAAIYLIPRIVNNEQVNKIPDKALQLFNAKLDAWISDTLKEKKDE